MTGLPGSILAVVAELRRADGTGALEQFVGVMPPAPKASVRGNAWMAPTSTPDDGYGYGDNLMKAVWNRGLLALDHPPQQMGVNGRKRVVLRPAAEIADIIRQLEDEDKDARRRFGIIQGGR
jgi:hypothetical protein